LARLGIQHMLLRVVAGGDLIHSPEVTRLLDSAEASATATPAESPSPLRVLDVGCGPRAFWTLEMAMRYPHVQFLAVDVAPLSARVSLPENVTFSTENILKGLSFPDNHFDFVFQRLLIGSVPATKWPAVIKELMRVTKNGGFLELGESCVLVCRPGPHGLKHNEALLAALGGHGLDPKAGLNLGQYCKEAGLERFKMHANSMPVGWNGPIGVLAHTCISQSFVGLKMFLQASSGMTDDEYAAFCSDFLVECAENLSYFNIYYVTAKLPRAALVIIRHNSPWVRRTGPTLPIAQSSLTLPEAMPPSPAPTGALDSSNGDDAVIIYVQSPAFPPDLAASLRARGARVVGPFPDLAVAAEADASFARAVHCVVNMGGTPPGLPRALPLLPNLRLVCCYGSGFNEMLPLLPECRKKGVTVTHSPAANAACVADHAMVLMLACTRRIVAGDRFVRSGAWGAMGAHAHASSYRSYPKPRGLADLRLGILGLGAIGRLVARRAAAFDMQIGYCNRNPSPDADPSYEYFPTPLALATWCDVLVIALRSDATNQHIVDAAVLTALGPGGFLVNISRGLAVDEAALAAALAEGRLAGCGLDVFEHEPKVHPDLLRLGAADDGAPPYVVLQPHSGGWTERAFKDMAAAVLANIVAVVFENRPPISPVPGMEDVTGLRP
ncbi:hypothetical protein HK405_007227, partial [Cladochytrium tenue]